MASKPRKDDGSMASSHPRPKSPWVRTPRNLWSSWTRGSSITIAGIDWGSKMRGIPQEKVKEIIARFRRLRMHQFHAHAHAHAHNHEHNP